MGLVETVTGELFEQIEDLIRLGLGDIVLLRATFHEDVAMLLHLLDLLLAHRAPQQIRAAQRIAAEKLRGLHHLFLIDQNAVSFFRDRLEQRMFILDLELAVTAFDEVGNEVHRAGTIQRHERRDVFHARNLKLAAQIAHPTRFQLEHAQRFRAIQQVVSLLVIQRQLVHVQRHALRALDHFASVANDRKRLQSEKIHLQQAEFAYGIHRILRHERAVFVGLERQQIHQRLGPNHHARCVNAGVARQIFEHECGINQFARRFFRLVSFLEFRRLLERFFERHL